MGRMSKLPGLREFALGLLCLATVQCAHQQHPGVRPGCLPPELCFVDTVAPTVRTDLKYSGTDNFVGRPIDGYGQAKRAVLRRDVAQALRSAADSLAAQGLGLLIWDAYRPKRALRDFRAWSRTPDDRQRREFYPNLTKQGIYDSQYIGDTSEHCWGIAVDITLVDLASGEPLDMGGRHDLLDPRSATVYAGLTPKQQSNRLTLKRAMENAGFRNYSKEWWHYFYSGLREVYEYDFALDDSLHQE